MRVFVVIGQLNHRCGPSVHGIRLVRQLIRMGYEAYLMHRTPEGQAEERLLDELSDVLLPLPTHHPLDPRQGIEFARHLRLRPDVVVFRLQTAMYNLAPIAHHAGAKTLYMAAFATGSECSSARLCRGPTAWYCVGSTNCRQRFRHLII